MDYEKLTFSHLLHLTAHNWRLAVNRRLKDLGMSQASWVAVSAIASNETPLTQKELAHQLGIEGATLVPLINRLVEQNLVQRVLIPEDKRVRLLVATEQGQALYQKVKVVADELRQEVLASISEEEQALTRNVLTRLLKATEAK
ncbi:MarR family transcriptional regulator [Enterobacteriaceae bacterium H20N1]|uniref:MarR family transcriptional regulator n=1 Tax=Dryocola boscaweniae TaxID=2925397 RepID=A0A9X2WAF8_9ENTR|nr:MarR family transcriptional regulator [Dryocola boscaweniae]MCT4703905.1 MarR family transcriptional regulator [Dryocola boscaweniae]MCT4717085.1 MarR family transcriptional regulator [Dryocola boscaweniae]MCT4721073.1 MarR family transcriptional regulator [Dryocola boscaweniae]